MPGADDVPRMLRAHNEQLSRCHARLLRTTWVLFLSAVIGAASDAVSVVVGYVGEGISASVWTDAAKAFVWCALAGFVLIEVMHQREAIHELKETPH